MHCFNVKIIEKTAVYHSVNGDPAFLHTSKTPKMIKGILLRALCHIVNVLQRLRVRVLGVAFPLT